MKREKETEMKTTTETLRSIARIEAAAENHGDLMDYDTGCVIRSATAEERAESLSAAESDGGAGVITVDGRRCYVAD